MKLSETKAALQGIRVLDFSAYGAGPYCGMLLGQMGAEVIRIEKPGGGWDREFGLVAPDGESCNYKALCTSKKGITLNIRIDKGREVLDKLIEKSDVVLHNFAPGSPEVKILDYSRLRQVNPKIILAAISGFGQDGPYAEHLAFDPTAQAFSGATSITGFKGNPPTKEGVTYVDFGTGTTLAFGIVLALYYREKTGIGQMVDASLVKTAVAFITGMSAVALYIIYGEIRRELGNCGFSTYSNCFKAKDGWVMVNPAGEGNWRRFARLIGAEHMIGDPKFQNDVARWENRGLIDPIVEKWVAKRTVDEVVTELQRARVCSAKTNTIAEMVEHPQVIHQRMIEYIDYPGVEKVPVPGVLARLSETPGQVYNRAPLVGEHNEQIYSDLLGFSQERLSQMSEDGII